MNSAEGPGTTAAKGAHGARLLCEQLVEVIASIRSQSPMMHGPAGDGVGDRPITSDVYKT
ncbi:hypothetical protein ACFC08_10545 [Streptomyces sp. NPDC056112]|uniref:hypothetical protein n=1 Tax=unclassified Streptomyces TaxID=2593676 RepID=UPI001CD81239|nr:MULTISPECIES: hypothetical protein [unclassified Streptomyces]